tara:strand:+ start:2391 stop:2636 length:246 start_codon:yes stop_codon:yes gene_type:complete
MDVISKLLMFIAGFVMVISSADCLYLGEGEVIGYSILSAHWWVMLVVGILLCSIAILEQNDKHLTSKLDRLTSDLNRLKKK